MYKCGDMPSPRVVIKESPTFEFEIFFPLKPVAWERAGRKGDRYYDAQAQQKLVWGLLFKKHFPYQPFKEPVGLHMEFRIPPTRALSAQFGQTIEGVDHARVPDLDNYVKFLLDALTPLAWENDCQIVSLHARKFWSFEPGVLLRIIPVRASSSQP